MRLVVFWLFALVIFLLLPVIWPALAAPAVIGGRWKTERGELIAFPRELLDYLLHPLADPPIHTGPLTPSEATPEEAERMTARRRAHAARRAKGKC